LKPSSISKAACGLAILLVCASSAHAVQVQDLVRLKGAETSKLIGVGLVVGLAGTGDGKFTSATRSVVTLLNQFMDPNAVAAEIKDTKNVAVVTLTAELPSSGVQEGDRVDVHIASIGGAKSLQGGRLFMVPMTGPRPGMGVFAFAEGPITVENSDVPTVGVVPEGAQLTRSVFSECITDGRLTLVLRNDVATWPMANNLASLINGVMAPDGPEIARAIDEKNVVVFVPPAQLSNPATFISQILTSYIDPAMIGTGARVVINERTGTIVMTGDVEISPVVISHNGLTISTITPPPPFDPEAEPGAPSEGGFIGLDPDHRGGARLSDLIAAFNQLKVPAQDRITIIKEIKKSGKLHATLIIE
jgi:flagellar P-ring protein precursor FlgI